MARILITGGAGFIGSHLADRLLATEGPWWEYYSRESVRELVSV